jgi:hypothetical protein
MWSSIAIAVTPTRRNGLLCALALVAFANWPSPTKVAHDAVGHATGAPAAASPAKTADSVPITTSHRTLRPANAVIAATSLAAVRVRWDSIWSADVGAAELNAVSLNNTAALMERAEQGDLEATVDLIGAATWCLAAGPLANVTDQVGDERRPCFERFGVDLASRERLERASFAWVLRLAAAGVEDATLYASALTRGMSADMLGGPDAETALGADQRALLISQLQGLAERGSADAASELHGHWSGLSAFKLADVQLVRHYAELTERLDPARNLAFVTQ